MQRGSKTISNSLRPRIDTLKHNIRFAKSPFDGSDSVIKTAIRELRAEGIEIIHDKKMCRYYNPKTIDASWGY